MNRLLALLLLIIFTKTLVVAQKPLPEGFKSRLVLANKIKEIKNDDSAANYAQNLLATAKSEKNKVWQAQILLAQSYRSYILGNVETAKNLGRQSAILANVKDSATYIKSHLMVAYMLNRQGKDGEALKVAFDMMRKAENLKWGVLLVECKICIADIYRTVNEPNKGLVYSQQAYNDAKKLQDTSIYIFAISTLSNLYSNKGLVTPENLVKATRLYETIVNEPYLSTLSTFSKARHLSNLARLYEMRNQHKLAEQVLISSIAISKKEGYKNIEAHALNELMTVKIDQGNYQQAIAYGQRADSLLAKENTNNILQKNIYRNLSSAYVALKDFEKALNYSDRSSVISDTLAAKNKIEIAERLDEEYKADKRIIEASASAKLMKQQRNFSILMGAIIVLALIVTYRWFYWKRKRQAALLAAQHTQQLELNALKTKFFTNISHELRTPLTLISGPVEQLYHEEINLTVAQKRSYIETIWLNSRKLLNLFNELLELGKLESGNIKSNPQPKDIHQLIGLIYQGFSSAARYKKIDYELSIAIPKGLIIEIDGEKLEKILSNLISNALKFTPLNGKIIIEVSLSKNELILKVTDNGKGIPKDQLDQIFDRYYQVANNQEVAEGGTGIGLALAKELTQLLGGSISAQSTIAEGSTFIVAIPAKIQSPALKVNEETIAKLPSQGEMNGLVLIVEDQVEMASYISSILSPHYQLLFASNGLDAINLLNQLEDIPSLIISDIMMPEMDGLSLLRKLKQHEIFCRIPVVMLTAIADETSKYDALNIGVDDYLTKPFDYRELLARVANLIDNLKERSNFLVREHNGELDQISNEVCPADLLWLKDLETLVTAYTGKKNLDVATISYEMAVSERQLFRNIKRITGLTPNKYIRSVRLQIAREAIASGKYKTVSEIAYVAGFETPAYFSKLFKAYYGRDINDLIR